MKAKIHPEYVATKVTCSGCGTTFDSHSTVDTMQVDVCSNCHPFYTGKQKLVDTAGRVDRFKAKTEAAAKRKEALAKKSQKTLTRQAEATPEDTTTEVTAPKAAKEPAADTKPEVDSTEA